MQHLPLFTRQGVGVLELIRQNHVRFEFGHQRHVPVFAQTTLGAQIHVGHVPDHNVRGPVQVPRAIVDARLQKHRIIPIGRGGPRNQRCQQHIRRMLAQPEPQRVFFVADEITTLPLFAAARSGVRAASTVLAQGIFLYALVAAGKSVASIKATVLAKPAPPSSSGASRCSLMERNFVRSSRCRKSCSILTSGRTRRLRRRAKTLHVRCSASNWTNRLNECAGVSSASKWTRNS